MLEQITIQKLTFAAGAPDLSANHIRGALYYALDNPLLRKQLFEDDHITRRIAIDQPVNHEFNVSLANSSVEEQDMLVRAICRSSIHAELRHIETIDHTDVAQRAHKLRSRESLTLLLITPLRIIDQKKTMRSFSTCAFSQRLVTRLWRFDELFGAGRDNGAAWTIAYRSVAGYAQQTGIMMDATTWRDETSQSARTGKPTPVGGLIGMVAISIIEAAGKEEFLEVLAWGELLHAGRNTAKGYGQFTIV